MRTLIQRLAIGAVIVTGVPAAARAQAAPRPALVEGGAGFAQFMDDSPINHSVFDGGGRIYVSRRVAIGPEVTVMFGPGIDRDFFLTGNATIDLVDPSGPHAKAVPYVVGGAGFIRTTLPTGAGSFTSSEGAFTVGAGVRIAPANAWYVAPEFRFGWELHWRLGVQIGKRF